jgi:hypothetical protein
MVGAGTVFSDLQSAWDGRKPRIEVVVQGGISMIPPDYTESRLHTALAVRNRQ